MIPTLLPVRIDWQKLAGRQPEIKLTHGGCQWVSRESIAECLSTGHLEDASLPQTDDFHHAARIACLVRLLAAGERIDPMTLNVLRNQPARSRRRDRLTLWFEDGSHRFRAHEFLGLHLPLGIVLRGSAAALRDLLRLGYGAILPAGTSAAR